jgi:hypothetical protein
MQNGALCKVAELSADTRHVMESILGRSLQEDEVVTINTYKLAPRGRAREETSRHLLERIDKTAQKVERVPEEQIDAAIDEAVEHVRHHSE